MGQAADVTIDAIPRKIFHGTVTEIGDNAIVRSTGVSTSQATSTSEEAKDFKVVVTLPMRLWICGRGFRPPRKSHRHQNDVVSIPIQALTIRNRADSPRKMAPARECKRLRARGYGKQGRDSGRFCDSYKKAEFVAVDTGISGTTDIEVTKGVKEGDEVITGSYKVLRTLKPGTSVKIDNSKIKKEEESS